MLPSIKNAVGSQNPAKNTNLDLRSDELHPSNLRQVRPQKDLQSDRLHSENDSHVALDTQYDFPRLVTTRCDRMNHCGESSVDSHQSDDEFVYDIYGVEISHVSFVDRKGRTWHYYWLCFQPINLVVSSLIITGPLMVSDFGP